MTVATENNQLPFSSSKTLKEELIENYLVDAIEWITGPSTKGKRTLRAVSADNPWETALSIKSILASKGLLEKHSYYRDEYTQAIEEAVNYLTASVNGDKELASWDKNPFDTGLAIQSLVLFRKEFPESKISDYIDENKTIGRGISWIVNYCENWMQDRTIGEIDDISVCIRALIKAEELFPEKNFLKNNPDIVHIVIKEILIHATKNDSCLHWSDIYSSAYILILLQEYIAVHPKYDNSLNIIDNMRYTLNHIEQSFSGNWVQPPDTALTLLAYMKSGVHPALTHDVLPEIVYLCFRWLCDSKQCYGNGSIQRSIHYTSLFIDAALFACTDAKIDDRVMNSNIAHVNDYVLRQIIQRDKIERNKHTIDRIKYEKLEIQYNCKSNSIKKAHKLFYGVSSYFIWTISLLLFLAICKALELLTFSSSSPYIAINSVNDGLPIIFAIGGLLYAFTRIVTKRIKNYIEVKIN